jgi:hypothetical protein
MGAMILVRVDCEYPGTDEPPSQVVFEPLGLGGTPADIHSALIDLLRRDSYVEIETTEGRLPFSADTVRMVLVWSQGGQDPQGVPCRGD